MPAGGADSSYPIPAAASSRRRIIECRVGRWLPFARRPVTFLHWTKRAVVVSDGW